MKFLFCGVPESAKIEEIKSHLCAIGGTVKYELPTYDAKKAFIIDIQKYVEFTPIYQVYPTSYLFDVIDETMMVPQDILTKNNQFVLNECAFPGAEPELISLCGHKFVFFRYENLKNENDLIEFICNFKTGKQQKQKEETKEVETPQQVKHKNNFENRNRNKKNRFEEYRPVQTEKTETVHQDPAKEVKKAEDCCRVEPPKKKAPEYKDVKEIADDMKKAANRLQKAAESLEAAQKSGDPARINVASKILSNAYTKLGKVGEGVANFAYRKAEDLKVESCECIDI